MIAAQDGGTASIVADLLAAAREQADRWKTPALLAHNATADCTLREALDQFGFRTFYHYALRPAGPVPSGTTRMADSASAAGGNHSSRHDGSTTPAAVTSPATVPAIPPDAASAIPPAPLDAPFRLPPSAFTLPEKPELDGLSMRHATSADLNEIVALGIESVRYHAALDPTMHVPRGEDGKMRRRFQAILREPQHGALFVAMLDWQIVAFYSLYLQSIDDSWTPPLFAPGRYGLLAEVAVAEGLRGRGVGRRLFHTVEQWFRERGAQRFWLIYLLRNPLSSRFWPSLGFQPVWDVMLAGA